MADPVFNLTTGDIVQITWFGQMNNQAIIYTTNYRYSAPAPNPDGSAVLRNAISSHITNLWTARLKAMVSEAYSLREIRGQKVASAREPYVSEPVIETGSVIGDNFPQNVAFTLTFQSAVVGRGNAGSKHIVGGPPADVEEGKITDAALGDWNDLADTWASPITMAGDQVLTPGSVNPVTFNFKPFFAGHCQQTVRVERRRTVGLGI